MTKYLIVFVLLFQVVFAQSFEKKSTKFPLNIKVPPPDTIAPVIKLIRPLKYANFPVYSRDTVYTLCGNLDDNSNKTMMVINGTNQGYTPNGPFKYDVKLQQGKNLICVSATDKKGNMMCDTLVVIQDSTSENNPPIVKITQPKILMQRGIKVVPKFESNDSTLTIKGTISDESDILGLWINKNKVTEFDKNEFLFTFYKGVPDSILIEAADKYGNLYREVLTALKEKLAESEKENIRYYALLVTVEEYRDKKINSLDNPVKDGEKLKKVLLSNYTFEEKNVIHLINPTRAEIMSEFQKLRKTLGQNDNLLIFYAGHGHWDEEIQQGYWLPSDAHADNTNNYIANSTIKDYIKGLRTKHTLLIADACFSGNFFRSMDQKSSDVAYMELYKSPSRTAMTSGTKSDKVPDKSVFVEYLIQRLETNQEKYWEADKLYQSIKNKVRFNSPDNQAPAYGRIEQTGDDGLGDFIFVRK